MPRVLIVDDEPDICELVSMSIGGAGYITDTVLTSKAAIKKLKENHYDLVFTDIRLPDGDGIDLLSYVQKNFPRLPVCIMTAHGNMDMAVRALRLGAFDFVQKPFDMKQMRQICKNAIGNATPAESASAKGAPARAGGKSGGKYQIIGDSPAMVSLRQMIERIAKSLAPVFIHGESGTGKEVAARSIHQLSARANAPFIAVNCGAIPETLVESEFFGYKKGAFTGEVSAAMIASTGARYVIIGHSERRAYYHETPEILKEKVRLALAHGLTPIFCVGEVLAEREAGKHFDVVDAQIRESLFDLTADDFGRLILAYEPVWAIGTGKTATAAQAQEIHAHIRQTIAAKYGATVADATSILYGGSCNAGNARELFANPDVDGGLIGGASLEVEKFLPIIEVF